MRAHLHAADSGLARLGGQSPGPRRYNWASRAASIKLPVAIAQHLSKTGNLIQIYSDRELFDTATARAAG